MGAESFVVNSGAVTACALSNGDGEEKRLEQQGFTTKNPGALSLLFVCLQKNVEEKGEYGGQELRAR